MLLFFSAKCQWQGHGQYDHDTHHNDPVRRADIRTIACLHYGSGVQLSALARAGAQGESGGRVEIWQAQGEDQDSDECRSDNEKMPCFHCTFIINSPGAICGYSTCDDEELLH